MKVFFLPQKNGFYIECGALDGVARSNSLSLERQLGWEGILIEADPDNLIDVLCVVIFFVSIFKSLTCSLL